jgi:4-hydroxy-2-oxoheptanedioate aldolase
MRRTNAVKALLRAGKPALGTFLNLPCVTSAEILAHAGWDWLSVDAEHAAVTIETMANMFTAIGTTEVMPFCRIPDNDPVWVKRILDAGAMGVIVPMVCSAEDARRAVSSAKYAPEGIRSAGGGRWRFWAGDDYPTYANDEIFVAVMIEHIDAVNRAEEILSVPGVDACFIGPRDLAFSMGLGKGPFAKDPAHADAIARVAAAAKKVGVPAGIHAGSVDEIPKRLAQGFRFIACSSELNFMNNAAIQAARTIREMAGRNE